jgi:hypothetical protein
MRFQAAPAPPGGAAVTAGSLQSLKARYWKAESLVLGTLITGIVLAPMDGIRVTGMVTASDVFFFFAIAQILFFALAGRSRVWPAWAYIVCMVVCIIALGFHPRVYEGVTRRDTLYMVTLLTSLIMVPWALSNVPGMDWGKARWLFFAWVLGTTLGSLIAVLQSRGISLGFVNQWLHMSGKRFAGATLSPNTLGTISASVVPVVVVLWLNTRQPMLAWFWAGCAFFNLWAVDLSGSRSGLAAIFASTAAVLPLPYLLIRRYRVPVLRIGVAVLVLVAALVIERNPGGGAPKETALDRLLGTTTSAKSDAQRATWREMSWQNFWDNPIVGNGYQFMLHAHNNFLSMMEMAGILGLLVLIVHQLMVGRAVLLNLRRSVWSPERFMLVLCLFASWLVFLVTGLAQSSLHLRVLFVPMGLLMLLLIQPQLLSVPSPVRKSADGTHG